MEQFVVNTGIYIGYVLVGLAVLAVIVLPLINALGNPKTLIKSVIGLIVLAVIFLIGYALSGSEVTALYTRFNVDAGLSKFIGGLLTTMYLAIVVAIIGILYSEVAKLVK